MTTTMHRCRAEVIEAYPNIGQAAVRFSWNGRERVECVPLYIGPDATALVVGGKGWARFLSSGKSGSWHFEPYHYSMTEKST